MIDTKFKVPEAELYNRIKNFQNYIQKNNIDGALILQKSDLFYFTGTIQDAHLYIPAYGEPLLMVKKSMERALAESCIKNIVQLKSVKSILDIIKEKGLQIPCKLGMELDVLPVNLYFIYQKLFSNIKIIDCSHWIRMIRAVKSDFEISMIKKSAILADKVLDSVKEFLREGISEIEFAGLVEARARKLGHQGIVRMRLWGSEIFYGHLMAGACAAVPSFLSSPTGGIGPGPGVAQSAGFKKIKRYEPVLVDYTFAFNGYISDQTRIFSLGQLSDELIQGHNAMVDIQNMLKKAAKPGVKAHTLYEMAVNKADEMGYKNNFMGADNQRIRFVGHGLGLELDEYPFIAKAQNFTLQESMVIALEPKLIFPDKGVVGIENTHVVTAKGLEQLTNFGDEIVVL